MFQAYHTPRESQSGPAIGLNGYHVPGPAAIGLLGLGGLIALRRRHR